MYMCVDCVSRVSVSFVLLAVEILCKDDKAFGLVGKNPSMEDLPGSSLLTTVVHKTL